MIQNIEVPVYTRTVRVCDTCRSEGAHQCLGCNSDLCSKCLGSLWGDPWNGGWDDDSKYPYCAACYALAQDYGARVTEIRAEADQKIDILRDEWSAKCRAAKALASTPQEPEGGRS